AENLATDHLSRLENLDLGTFTEEEITDEFLNGHLMILKANLNNDESWYADYVNYIDGKIVPPNWTPEKRRRFFSQVKNYFWDEPYAFKLCSDYGNKYILVAIDYVSKWVEAQDLPINDACVVIRFLRRLFARFGVPKALISDRRTHFCNSQLEKALQKYGVTHKLSIAYHPQTNEQTEVTNRAIKRILERSVGYNPKNWSEKLDDALWAFRTAYKTPTGCTPSRLVYEKACHLPVEIEHKAYWALKQYNIDFTATAKNSFIELNELIELRDEAYENTRFYKEQIKRWHDSRLRRDKDFKAGDKWYGPNVVKNVHPYGTVEIIDKNGISFKVNGQRLKKYHNGHINAEEKEVVELDDDKNV
ncbi:reverse transcriptase domain-containing protein, partial [Tanacetum coccineum]